MFERKAPRLSVMCGKTNCLRLRGIIAGAEVVWELSHSLEHSSVPMPSWVKTNNITTPGKASLGICHTYQDYQLWGRKENKENRHVCNL